MTPGHLWLEAQETLAEHMDSHVVQSVKMKEWYTATMFIHVFHFSITIFVEVWLNFQSIQWSVCRPIKVVRGPINHWCVNQWMRSLLTGLRQIFKSTPCNITHGGCMRFCFCGKKRLNQSYKLHSDPSALLIFAIYVLIYMTLMKKNKIYYIYLAKHSLYCLFAKQILAGLAWIWMNWYEGWIK